MNPALKNDNTLILKLVVLLIMQLVVTDYLNLGPLVCVSILPLIIFALPTSTSPALMMSIAFVCGCMVDGIAEGIWGINAFSLVLVAALRNFIVNILIDRELILRRLPIDMKKYGWPNILLCVTILTAVFFLAYCICDMASQRPLWFIIVKVICSTLISVALSVPALGPLFIKGRTK